MSQKFSATEYEKKYQQGYGVACPESHIIRVYKQIIEWELGMCGGTMFDFGCGSGSHVKYFADQGFVPYGCDTSETAVSQTKALLPQFADHFKTSDVMPDLKAMFGPLELNVFMTNQVLYYLSDADIHRIVDQAYAMTAKGGVFVASMMTHGCWYARDVIGTEGDFSRLQITSPRQTEFMLVNLKERDEIEPLFRPFRKLHLGSYGWQIRDEEGPHEHWLYVGIKD